MDILPITSAVGIVDQTHHDDHQNSPKRQPPRKRQKLATVPVYTPDGHVDQATTSIIDLVG